MERRIVGRTDLPAAVGGHQSGTMIHLQARETPQMCLCAFKRLKECDRNTKILEDAGSVGVSAALLTERIITGRLLLSASQQHLTRRMSDKEEIKFQKGKKCSHYHYARRPSSGRLTSAGIRVR